MGGVKRTLLAGSLVFLLAACGGTTVPASSSAAASAAASAKPSLAPAPSVSAAPSGAAASAKPAAAPPNFINGTIQTIAPDKITLSDGQSFTLTATTPFIRLQKSAPSDMKVGQSVAITAKLQQDGTLLASDIRIAAQPGASGALNASQFPMNGGNLMTNAAIKTVNSDGVVVGLPAGDVTVKLAPNATIEQQLPGSSSDAKPGATVLIIASGANPTAASAVGVLV